MSWIEHFTSKLQQLELYGYIEPKDVYSPNYMHNSRSVQKAFSRAKCLEPTAKRGYIKKVDPNDLSQLPQTTGAIISPQICLGCMNNGNPCSIPNKSRAKQTKR